MFPFDLFNVQRFPFTDFNKINLDWICDILSKIAGGGTGQYIKKKSDTDFDFEWSNTPPAGVSEVNGKTGNVTLVPSDIGAVSVNDCKYKIFNSTADLGITVTTPPTATLAAVLSAMPTRSIIISSAGEYLNTEVPNSVGVVMMIRATTARPVIYYFGRQDNIRDYRMFCDNSSMPTGVWIPLNPTYTDITVTLASNASVSPFTYYGQGYVTIPSGHILMSALCIDSSTADGVVVNASAAGSIYVYGNRAEDVTIRCMIL